MPVDKDKAEFEVKRGSVKPTVKGIEFSDDKKTATIEFNTAMAAGEYVVTVNGLSEEALTGKTTVSAEKLVKISFLSDVAVLTHNTATPPAINGVVTRVVAENQYGEDISAKLATPANSNISVNSSRGSNPQISADGVVSITGTASDFRVDDKVVVTIVDSTTGLTATKTLTVAHAAAVESIEIGELKTDDADLAKKTVNVANMAANAAKYYVPVIIKDQYGNALKAADLLGVDVFSSNKSIVNPKGFKDTKNGTVIELQNPVTPGTAYGTAVLTIVATGTGKTANTSIVVKENAKLDVVTLEGPSTSLKVGVASELPVSITDTYDEEVALKDVTIGGNPTSLTLDGDTTITATGATLKVEQDYVNKKAVLKVTPTGTPSKHVSVVVISATGKSQVLNFNAEDTPVVSGIKGLDADFVSLLANDGAIFTDLAGAIEFVDQYGDVIPAPAYDHLNANPSALDFEIEAGANNTTTLNNTGTITSSTIAGTEDFKIILKDGSDVLDTLNVTVSIVDKDKLTAFGIDDLSKFYTGVASTSTGHDKTISVHGLHNGKKVKINQTMIRDAYATNGLAGFSVGISSTYTPVVITTDGKDVASTLNVLVSNKDNTYTISKDILYSDAAPTATSVVAKYDGVDVKGGAIQVPFAELNKSILPAGTESLLQFVAKDQYGVQRDAADYSIVVTNKDSAMIGTVSSTGVGSGFVAADVGKSLQLNVRIDGHLQSVKVIVAP